MVDKSSWNWKCDCFVFFHWIMIEHRIWMIRIEMKQEITLKWSQQSIRPANWSLQQWNLHCRHLLHFAIFYHQEELADVLAVYAVLRLLAERDVEIIDQRLIAFAAPSLIAFVPFYFICGNRNSYPLLLMQMNMSPNNRLRTFEIYEMKFDCNTGMRNVLNESNVCINTSQILCFKAFYSTINSISYENW